jgi:hypothetical protein
VPLGSNERIGWKSASTPRPSIWAKKIARHEAGRLNRTELSSTLRFWREGIKDSFFLREMQVKISPFLGVCAPFFGRLASAPKKEKPQGLTCGLRFCELQTP